MKLAKLKKWQEKGMTLTETMLVLVIIALMLYSVIQLFVKINFDNDVLKDNTIINEIRTNTINQFFEEPDIDEASRIVTENLVSGALSHYSSHIQANGLKHKIITTQDKQIYVYPKRMEDRILRIILELPKDPEYCQSIVSEQSQNFDLIAIDTLESAKTLTPYSASGSIIKNKQDESNVDNTVTKAIVACNGVQGGYLLLGAYDNAGDERAPIIENFKFAETDKEYVRVKEQLLEKLDVMERTFKKKKTLIFALDDAPTSTENQKVLKPYTYLVQKIKTAVQFEPNKKKTTIDLRNEMTKLLSDADTMINRIEMLK